MTLPPSVERRDGIEPYRLDLFLSVDIVGSTAYKFSQDVATRPDQLPSPEGLDQTTWFHAIGKFYEHFHRRFMSDGEAAGVALWKALGDELVYRAVIRDRAQTAALVAGFAGAVQETREVVQGFSRTLDLKACAWVADFPVRNVTISIDGLRSGGRQVEDFIGPSMDVGFRLGGFATRRKMVVSVELALILATGDRGEGAGSFTFGYDRRESLKGVLGGDAYPLLWIDLENDRDQMEVNRCEARLQGRRADLSRADVVEFCRAYMAATPWMEMPHLGQDGAGDFADPPPSYGRYVRKRQARLDQEAERLARRDTRPPGPEDGPSASDDLLGDMPVPSPDGDA